MESLRVGIDFGTTNSSIAIASGNDVRVARFAFMESVIDTFRSVLFFENAGKHAAPKPLAGPSAIERYLEPHEGGRLIQSLKSFAANRTFETTLINGRRFTLDELIGVLLRILRAAAEQQFGNLGVRAIAGRPVRFVGAESAQDEALALTRLRRAYAIAGFSEIEFEYEPVGAAHAYAQRLTHPELVLIADFGGGTSDFSLVRLGERDRPAAIVGSAGVPVGGDTFDARIIHKLVSPLLGLGSEYRSLDKTLPVPHSLYRKLESWHHLSFLRSREVGQMLQSIMRRRWSPRKSRGYERSSTKILATICTVPCSEPR